jgi:hypothetical protein
LSAAPQKGVLAELMLKKPILELATLGAWPLSGTLMKLRLQTSVTSCIARSSACLCRVEKALKAGGFPRCAAG